MKTKHSKRDAALAIVKHLRRAGHTALFAGGCVRDLQMGLEPKDYDVATDAVPLRIAELFRRTQQVGAKFGVVIVGQYGHTVEVATFRSDGDYLDGRHPENVVFSNPLEDARRRDFTINGMFLDPLTDQVIDHVGGLEDLRRGLIRAIGDPQARFVEDHLRMLRAVRFAARLAFELDGATADAIVDQAQRIAAISAERIRIELLNILTESTRARGWKLMYRLGLANRLIPDLTWTDAEAADVEARLAALPATCSDALALAVLFRKGSPTEAARWCRRLACSNQQTVAVRWLLDQLPRVMDCAAFETADFKLLLAQPGADDLAALLAAEIVGRSLSQEPLIVWRERTAQIEPASISPERFITGDDLLTLGMPPGPGVARVLERLYRRQLNGIIVTRQQALTEAKALTHGETP
ncbi:MAG: CCA tRNA nucleotidyltransferase [Phycisphaerae bacterium]